MALTRLQRPLDTVFMFAVAHHKVLGVREDNVLLLDLQKGVQAATLERVRNGDTVDSRPLSSLRSVENDAGSAGVRLLFHGGGGGINGLGSKASALHLTARSPADASSIATLLRALTQQASSLRLREDDADMPPPARHVHVARRTS